MNSQSPESRHAFTVTDLLIVLMLGAMLLALGLPAVQQAKEDADRKTCEDNLRKLGEAFHLHARDQGGFPGRRNGYDITFKTYGGWGSNLLPYINLELAKDFDRDYDFFDPVNQKVSQTTIPTFVCPAAPRDRKTTVVSNASGNSKNPDKDTTYTVHCGPNDYLASNGLFLPTAGYGAIISEDMRARTHQALTDNESMRLTEIVDGLSCTLLIIERAGSPQTWHWNKRIDRPQQFALANNTRGTWAGWGSLFFGVYDGDDPTAPGRGDGNDCAVNCNNFYGIYGFHEKGANVLMCDGSVRFIGLKLNGLTLARLTNRDDGQLLADDDIAGE
ncbi:DUF1559 family PulG-like putative transporter [Anatilimnocola floriformis]|uniref:DUF1559 family PulG-like putative transporter n=1 Tax=Anatilimnocola floriformis TaxID=2948575 RepID=UPI0020C27D7D|nr:DUF1559 domain-containing protein [Anatilimnocola floriformis]